MSSRGKKKTTMAKLNREAKQRERRNDKQARKVARRDAAANAPDDGMLIVHGRDRAECIARTQRCLGEMVVSGIETTIPLHQRIIGEQAFIDGDYDIHWLEKLVGLKK